MLYQNEKEEKLSLNRSCVCFVIEMHEKGLPITHQTMQLKSGETAKPLKIDDIFKKEKKPGVSYVPISQNSNCSIRA